MLRVGKVGVRSRNILSIFGEKRAENVETRRYSSGEISLPKYADVVVIGGGIIGCNTFYHLTKLGVKPVLLEWNKLTNTTGWHSGGFVWSLRANDTDIQLLQTTRNLLRELKAETGIDPGWTNTGGLFIARNAERLEEYKRLHTLSHFFNVDSKLISPKEAKQLCELLDTKAVYGALYSPEDGFVDPGKYCDALVEGGLKNGGQVIQESPVTKILTEDSAQGLRKIMGVETRQGTIKTSLVVNAAGVWSRKIAQMVGVDIPITPIRHSYVITGSVPGAEEIPCVRDHDGGLYFRSQGDSVLLGGYEQNPEILQEVPNDFNFKLYEMDMEIFKNNWKKACELCPSFAKAEIKTKVCGPESFTPDHKPIMGEDPRVVGLFHGAGFGSKGVQLSGGAGSQLASWVVNGRPQMDMHSFDLRRFSPVQRTNRAWITESSHERYVKSYSIVYPNDQPLSGRNLRIDPFHEQLVAIGAVMEQSIGWERPAYFIQDRTAPVRGYDWYGSYDHPRNTDKRYLTELEGDLTYGFSKHHETIKEEALACRNNVALFDLSCYTKMYLTGPDAEEAADWLFTADLGKTPGKVNYTCSLNSKGGVEADVIVTTLEEGRGTLVGPILKGKGYYVVAGGASGYETVAHLRKQMFKKNFKSLVTEITDRLGILSIQGPKSGELLQSVTESPITDDRFPFGMSHIIKINNHVCRAMRISHVGELGYELHVPAASCVPVFNKIMEAGRGFDLKHAGFRALDALSCEKGYHLKNVDLRIDDNPVEAGLTRFCRKDGQYQGKAVVEKVKQEGVKKKRVFMTLQDNVPVYGLETIWRDEAIVGYLRRGTYGFSLDCPIGIGYVVHPKGKPVDNEFLKTGDYQIEIRNKKYPATLYLKSPFDPENQRLFGKYEHHFEEHTHFED